MEIDRWLLQVSRDRETGMSERIGLSQRERRSLAGEFDSSGVQLGKSFPDQTSSAEKQIIMEKPLTYAVATDSENTHDVRTNSFFYFYTPNAGRVGDVFGSTTWIRRWGIGAKSVACDVTVGNITLRSRISLLFQRQKYSDISDVFFLHNNL